MKHLVKILFLVTTILLSSCIIAQKKIENTLKSADQYYYQKDYENAFKSYEQVINFYTQKAQKPDGVVYASAGKCLYYRGMKEQAMEYFQTAIENNYEDELTLYLMLQYYKESGQIDEEIDCLNLYLTVFPDGMDIKYVRERLFLTYYQRENYIKAYEAYKNLPAELYDNIDILEKYFHVNEKLSKFDEANTVARKIYNLDPNNLIGLNFVAYNEYSKAENEYKEAEQIYQKRKTKANLKTMRTKIKALMPRYRTAKQYYLRLYDLYKRPEDAVILSNIYTRLGEKKNAAYYLRLSKS